MIHSQTGESYLIDSIEIMSSAGTPFFRVTTQPVVLNSKDMETIRKTKSWTLDNVGVMKTRSVSLNQSSKELVICLLMPFGQPFKITFGHQPEMLPPGWTLGADGRAYQNQNTSSSTCIPSIGKVNCGPFQQEDDILDDPDFDPDMPLEDIIKKYLGGDNAKK